MALKISNLGLNMLPKTKLNLEKIAKVVENLQIWSHCPGIGKWSIYRVQNNLA